MYIHTRIEPSPNIAALTNIQSQDFAKITLDRMQIELTENYINSGLNKGGLIWAISIE